MNIGRDQTILTSGAAINLIGGISATIEIDCSKRVENEYLGKISYIDRI